MISFSGRCHPREKRNRSDGLFKRHRKIPGLVVSLKPNVFRSYWVFEQGRLESRNCGCRAFLQRAQLRLGTAQ
jgi:hypothetical protein